MLITRPKTKLVANQKLDNFNEVTLVIDLLISLKWFVFCFTFKSFNLNNNRKPSMGKIEKIRKEVLNKKTGMRKPNTRTPKAEPKDWKELKNPEFDP